MIKKIKKTLRIWRKNGVLSKAVVVLATLALLATSVLPFIL